MTGKRCELKAQYATRRRALMCAAGASKKRGKAYYVFKCRICRYFHLTSIPR